MLLVGAIFYLLIAAIFELFIEVAIAFTDPRSFRFFYVLVHHKLI